MLGQDGQSWRASFGGMAKRSRGSCCWVLAGFLHLFFELALTSPNTTLNQVATRLPQGCKVNLHLARLPNISTYPIPTVSAHINTAEGVIGAGWDLQNDVVLAHEELS